MRVDDSNAREVGQSGLNRASEATRIERSSGYGSIGRSDRADDRVQLSTLGAQLRAEESESPERTAHIERLRADVASGRYQLDAGATASRMIDDSIQPKS